MLLNEIEVLLVVSNAKSLSQAAEQLYMSRPGLSQKLSHIESKFGAKLFERTSTGIELTPAGRLVKNFAGSVYDLERGLAARLAAIDESFPATLHIGMSINDGVYLLPRLVAAFVKEHPEARVHLDAEYEPELIQKLHDGELDFAIVENQAPVPGIQTELLGYRKLCYIAPNKAPYTTTPNPVPVETLLKWPMIIYEWNSGRHMVGNRHYRERYGISLKDHNMVACFDTHEAMIEGVRAGLGWATVPDCVLCRYKNDSTFIKFTVDTDPLWYPVELAWSTGGLLSDNARVFMDFIRHNLPEGYFSKSVEAIMNS